jgi:hypothetical protein
MTSWKLSDLGRAAQFRDEDLDLEILAFGFEGDLFAEIGLHSLTTGAIHRFVLGPFAHFAAISDFVTGILIRLEAETEDGIYDIVVVPDAEVPREPEVPLIRSFANEMMSPVMAADLTWEAQEILDSGGDVVAGIADLEKNYLGDRYDATSAADYAAQGNAEVLRLVEADAVTVDSVAADAATTTALPSVPAADPVLGFPDVIRPIPVDAPMEPLVLASEPARAPFPNMPRAAVPKAAPFTRIDWLSLPVRVVEEHLSDQLSLLLSKWTGGKRVA